ncbi:unnamed protein product [Rhodiola kirilowii]
MDWFKWLSSTNLDPSLVHQYGILFTNNELQDEDIPFFNHEFLQSMGITIAKHRLEILKLLPPPLPTKGTKSSTVRLPMSKVLVAAKNTKKNFTKYMFNSWTKQRVDESKALTIVPDYSDDSTSGSIDHNHHGSRLSRGLTMLKRSKQRHVQPSKSAATTPECYYYPKKQQQHSISPIYASTPRIGSFSSSPFRKDCLQMADRMNYGHHVDDDDMDDGYWSAGVEETKWDTMFHNLKPT